MLSLQEVEIEPHLFFYIHLSKNTHIQCHSETKTEAEQRCLVWEVHQSLRALSSL